MTNDSDIINMLATLAEDNENNTRARLAACVVYKSKIVSFGVNQYKSHPFQLLYGKNKESIFLHAEVDAIYRATKRLTSYELSRSTIYVARVKRVSTMTPDLVFGLAKPCIGCARCIATFNLKRIVYTTDDGGFSSIECR